MHAAHSRFAAHLALLSLSLAACRTAPGGTSSRATAGFRAPPAVEHAARASTIDVEHYAIDIEIDPAARVLNGTCTVRLHPREDGLKRVELDLEGLDVRSVTDADGQSLAFAHEGSVLRIELAHAALRRDPVQLAIAYGGKPKTGLWFADPEGGVATQVFTQGECEDSRGWYPCFDAPSDRATSELRVTMPQAWTAVAAGERIDRVASGDRATETWRMSTPHPAYLTTLVAGDFSLKRGEWEGVPLEYLADPRYAASMDALFVETGDILGFYSQVTGCRYPYPKYSQACVANFPFGGMENISATTLTETALKDARGQRDSIAPGLIAHEAAHQWFGDLMTCDDWSHVWLNEGFATYMTALYTEHSRGADEFRIQMRDTQESYLARDTKESRRPVVYGVYRDPMDLFFSGHVYQGAAARLHMLRFVLDDEAFFRGLKLYVGRNAGRSVVTADLERAMEESSRSDLGWFFEQWFEKPGFPSFEVGWKYDKSKKLVILSVHQMQDVEGGVPAFFKTPVDVEVKDEKGTRVQRLSIEKRRHQFEIPAETEPVWVRFDPHGWIPKICDDNKKTSEWLAIAEGCDDVNGRRDALRVLGKLIEKPESEEMRSRLLAVLTHSLSSDKSGAVRAAAASALGSAAAAALRPVAGAASKPAATAASKDGAPKNGASATMATRGSSAPRADDGHQALMKSATTDAEARVRCAALDALGSWGESREIAELALREYAAGFSWDCMGSAAALLVKSRPAGAFDWLAAQVKLPSPHDVLAARIIGLIGDTQDKRALPLLASLAGDEAASDPARAAAVGALGKIGRGNADVRRELIGLLATESYRLRREVIGALGALADPAALSALSAYYPRSVFAMERRAIEAFLAAESRKGS